MHLERKIGKIVQDIGGKVLDKDLEFQVVKVENNHVYVDLLIGPEACEDCIVSDDMMKSMLLKQIQRSLPIIQDVRIARRNVG